MKSIAPVMTAVTFALLSTAAVAETQQDRDACMDDAFRVCWRAIPDRQSVYNCMEHNKRSLSGACRAAMARNSQPRPSTDGRGYSRHDEGDGPSRAEYRWY